MSSDGAKALPTWQSRAVMNPIEVVLKDARRERAEGRTEEAKRTYARAADLARSQSNELLLAHALRHLSELARERGETCAAWEHASEAVALYRNSGEERLGLANAIRLQALAACNREEARACWRQARDLYSSLSVTAGVTECDRHLAE